MGLIGVDVVDERPLAGRLVGWMFVMGSIVTTLLPLLPGVDGLEICRRARAMTRYAD